MLIIAFILTIICTQPSDIKTSLDKLGYPTPPFEIQLTWVERTNKGFCYGVLLLNTTTNKYEEIYISLKGELINNKELKLFGITPKKWDSKPIQIPGSLNIDYLAQKSINLPYQNIYEVESLKKKLYYPQNSITLPPPNITYEETENEISKGILIIGKIIDLDNTVVIFDPPSKVHTDSKTIDLLDVKSIAFSSYEAKGMRLKLQCKKIPPPQHKILIKGEYDNELKIVNFDKKEVWTPFISGSIAYMYYCKPISSSIDFYPITVSAYAYVFRDPIEELAKVASCYEDVMCHSPWNTMSFGVVGLESIKNKYLIYCTGSVLTDNNDATISNLILTANHCVPSQEKADTLEFLWFYQTDTCHGAVPSIYTIPITSGGATLLATSNENTGTDVTLLQMKNPPPRNIYEFGYANYPIDLNTEVVIIHHPGGSYKRISFGKTTNTGSPSYENSNLMPLDKFYEVKYYLSSTESGSSGSPLISTSTGVILGQLWGGTASCSAMDEPDYFGRFDVSYPILEPFLPQVEINYDVDGSGHIDWEDLSLVVNSSLGITFNPSSDLNKDGKFNAIDTQLICNKLNLQE